MNKARRRVVIAGNWKMNLTPSKALEFCDSLISKIQSADDVEIVVCVPAADLYPVSMALKNSPVKVGAQNVHWEKNGAYTGEISTEMLLDMGVEYVVIGHSERRKYFGESNESVNLRAKAAVSSGLTAIICVGETENERELGITTEVVSSQTKLALNGIPVDKLEKVIIAYEPVWAIGTGKTATAQEADRVNGIIRCVASDLYSDEAAQALTIQYGGSMNAKNASELLSKTNVDGGLIGGASLIAEDFAAIINAASR